VTYISHLHFLGVLDNAMDASRKQELHSYVAICAIAKDQPEDIVEWALYHLMIGVERIYIFDHNSTVPLINVLYPMVNSGNISYSYFK